MGTQNGNRYQWVGWGITLLVVVLGMAASYGALAYQVSEIKANGSIPVHELDKRVTALETVLPRIENQNKEDHQAILRNIDKLDKKISGSKSVSAAEPHPDGYDPMTGIYWYQGEITGWDLVYRSWQDGPVSVGYGFPMIGSGSGQGIQ